MTREIFYAEAIKEALAQEMKRDENVYMFGEDLGDYGGVFGVTMGLSKEFGEPRVRDTPLSEAAILGEAVGSAIYGLRPVPEIQFADFITVAMSQVIDLMAPYHYRVGTALPITIRIPTGGMLQIGNFHSNCWENWFAHVPGLKVVIPSTAYDAKGMLIAAIRDNNPVLFMEQKRLYRNVKDDVPEELYEVPLGKARIAKEGSDITMISYGSMMPILQDMLPKIEEKGISVELVDLRSIVPLDKETILSSFRKTGRGVIVHEARKSCGFGGEIASILMEEAFDDMLAPIIRVGSMQTPVPMSPELEKAYLPQESEIIGACEKLMKY
jgi:2-oxoisovalerate dehydrogenase E1 component beta subunit